MNVFGAKVPFGDGRIGMAALVPHPDAQGVRPVETKTGVSYELDEGVILRPLASHVAHRLPVYARPAFLRVSGAVNITITFKHQKVPSCSPPLSLALCFRSHSFTRVCVVQMSLQEEGFDLEKVAGDPVYMLTTQHPQRYVRLTKQMQNDIRVGKIRF